MIAYGSVEPFSDSPDSSRATKNIQKKYIIGFALGAALILSVPIRVHGASMWEQFFAPPVSAAPLLSRIHNPETPALSPAVNTDPNPAKGGGGIAVVDQVALLAEVGPEGTLANIEQAPAPPEQISLYVVRDGDTLSEIATMFDVSTNTVLWANDLKHARDIHPGDQLVILPISGVRHTVQKGETLASIVKKYKGDATEVREYNGLSEKSSLVVGDVIVIPHGVESLAAAPSALARGTSGPDIVGYFLRPVIGGRKSQGIHGYNGIDIAARTGTPVLASAGGTVTVAREYGWNGGYGNYVVISHANGTQTLYAHLSEVLIRQGASVQQGEAIGTVGSTGKSTGAHLHFEVRGAKNPF